MKELRVEETIPGGIFYEQVQKRIQFNIIHIESKNLGRYGGKYTLKVKNDIKKIGPRELFISSKNIRTVEEARRFALEIHAKFR